MSLDIDLFVEQAKWIAPKLTDPTRLGIATWLGRRLEPAARRRFLRAFPLAHPTQRAAEGAVCALLRRAIVVHASRLVSTDDVGRTVDWVSTYSRSAGLTRPPLPMLARVTYPVPDRASLGGLVTLAHTWRALLELGAEPSVYQDDFAQRGAALRAAVPPQIARGIAPVAFDARHAARLRRLDQVAADQVAAIEAAQGFWNRAFSSESDAGSLGAMGRLLDDADAANIDTMMEATVALSIARAATTAERPDWPTLFPWTLESVEDPSAMYPIVRLRSGDLICEVAKGTPTLPDAAGARHKIKDLLSPWADEALPRTGKARSSGRQPDVVVTFWFDGRPDKAVFALGDAKRNATGDGEGYIRMSLEVAATYLMSFGYQMGLQLPGAGEGTIKTLLQPGVTIFARQGTGRDAKSAIQMLRADRAPVVMAFDLMNHFEPEARPWHSPLLAAWLGSLGRQAVAALSEGGARPTRRARVPRVVR